MRLPFIGIVVPALERSSKRLFAFYRQGANDTANGPQVGPHPMNRYSDTRNGTGQLPACELKGWP